jgi:hypothetical protein
MKSIAASLKIRSDKLVGRLTSISASQAELKFDSPVEIGGRSVARVFLESKYGWPIEGSDARTVRAFWIDGPDQAKALLGEGLLQLDAIAVSRLDSLRVFYVRSFICVFWLGALSIAAYGGFRYEVLHGTVGSNMPVLKYAVSFVLSVAFIVSVLEWSSAGGHAHLARAFPGSLKALMLFLAASTGMTFFLFSLPAGGVLKAFNAWLYFEPPIRIVGTVVGVGPTLLTVSVVSRGREWTIEYYVAAVENTNDRRIYEIDIPKEFFERNEMHVGSHWSDVIYNGAFLPYRVGLAPPDQARS